MATSTALTLNELEKGELIWFDPGVGHALPGEVLEYHKPAQVLTVQAVIGGKPQVFSLTSANGLKRRQDLGQNGIEDMIQLNDLNEASLLWNLKIRYEKELIYTYTGSILVAVNPYKMYDMYGLDMVKKYEAQILGTLPPHLFAIGSAAYSGLTKSNQVVVISGESGSGKTESTKLVMQYLAAVNKSPSNLITEQILEASPLLESFGNAKTVRNDNSSRFGKYLEVYFKDRVLDNVFHRITNTHPLVFSHRAAIILWSCKMLALRFFDLRCVPPMRRDIFSCDSIFVITWYFLFVASLFSTLVPPLLQSSKRPDVRTAEKKAKWPVTSYKVGEI